MFNVFICDDQQIFRDKVKRYLYQYQEKMKANFYIKDYKDGVTLLEKFPADIDIIFLDIKMKPIDGIQVAEKIRKFNNNVQIVFITSATEYALDGYKVNAFDYIIKPITYDEFERMLTKVLKKVNVSNNKFITIRNLDILYRINISDIVYIETLKRHCIVHTMFESYISNKKLKEIENELCSKNFFRCNSGYIVNFDYIQKLVKSDVYLLNEDIISVSRPKKKIFIDKLTEYWGEEL